MPRDDSGARRHLLQSWLELREAVEDQPDIRRLLFDPVTGLPTTPLLFPRIEALLEDRGEVSLLCLNVVKYSRIEEIFGWKVFDDVLRHVARTLESITGKYMRDSDIVAELMIAGNSFVVVLSPPRDSEHIDPDALEALATRVEGQITEELEATVDADLFKKFGCYVGSTTIKPDEKARLERIVYDGLERALDESQSREAVAAAERQKRLLDIIEAGSVRTLVHPVFRLEDLSVVGYEALTRGPEGGEFERPDKLFKVAYDADLVLRLERLCRKRALEAAKELPEDRLLFMNIEPESVVDPQLRDITFSGMMADAGITPKSVVFEVTERSAISDFSAFRSALEYLRALGFSVAVDDAGAGYGSLQCLAEVNPEWVKVDMSLVRGIDTDDIRQQLLASLVRFTDGIGVNLVAEGIETKGELETVRELGVAFGQGFIFSEPVPPFPADEDFHLDDLA
jgi:EAL domain-containing protein (putative c-di-GMP-specific phosphodiesterase class I)